MNQVGKGKCTLAKFHVLGTVRGPFCLMMLYSDSEIAKASGKGTLGFIFLTLTARSFEKYLTNAFLIKPPVLPPPVKPHLIFLLYFLLALFLARNNQPAAKSGSETCVALFRLLGVCTCSWSLKVRGD
ncbi:unnamed protein product [Linum trigynum]|uniref:Uncharacterized protein n=1 Tax=Linum trigynum TaxID=586398 RepID=A0AAV2DJE2_9ROSI